MEEAIEAAAFLANNYDAIVAPKIDFHEFNFGVSFSSRGKKNTNRIAQSYSLCAFIDCVRYAFLARKDCRRATASFSASTANLKSIVTGTARATMVCVCVPRAGTSELSSGIMRMERLPSRRSFCLLKVYTKSKSRTILKKNNKKKESERREKKEERRKKNNER